jgi:pantetheine-phosphate adenylyltransferase
MKKSTVVYPGFFDPFTLGHQDIVTRATEVFEEVVVAVAKDSPKVSLFSFSTDRFEMAVPKYLKHTTNTFKVDSFNGLLIDYMKQNGMTRHLLRGLTYCFRF